MMRVFSKLQSQLAQENLKVSVYKSANEMAKNEIIRLNNRVKELEGKVENFSKKLEDKNLELSRVQSDKNQAEKKAYFRFKSSRSLIRSWAEYNFNDLMSSRASVSP